MRLSMQRGLRYSITLRGSLQQLGTMRSHLSIKVSFRSISKVIKSDSHSSRSSQEIDTSLDKDHGTNHHSHTSGGRRRKHQKQALRPHTQPPSNSLLTKYSDGVSIADPAVRVTGMDFIIHNMYADAGFVTFRKWFEDDADAMLARVASHVEKGLYSIISLQLSKHSCVVICASEKEVEDFPEDALLG